jgi:amidase
MVAMLDGFETATEMVRALRGREVLASELLELHLRRIERHNPRLNAIVIPDFDRARRDAAAADEALARGGDAAPLLGLPITIKDAIDTEGLPTTGGVESRAEAYPERDALIVQRLREAGAVIMGKTNVPPYLADWQADNPLFGRTNNPWDLERAPGGSTGGGGAALAAGLTPLEFGSDIGGSIRFPAAWCGVYGHRPSLTALPRSGHFPPLATALPNPTLTLNTVGPLARGAEDLALALDVTAGPEIGEEVAWRLELPPARHERLADFRVAVLPGADWRPVDGEIGAAVERLAMSLGRAGARVAEAQPEALGDLREHHELYQSLLTAITATRLSPEERRARAAELRAGSDPFGAVRARGLEASAADYIAWHEQRARYQAAWRAFFREWDVVLAPMAIVPAPPHSTLPPEERVLTVDGQTVPARILIVYSAVAIFSGLPSTAFPLGLTRGGLPIGLQAIGPYLEDRTPIRFAELVAREFGGFQRPPGYD